MKLFKGFLMMAQIGFVVASQQVKIEPITQVLGEFYTKGNEIYAQRFLVQKTIREKFPTLSKVEYKRLFDKDLKEKLAGAYETIHDHTFTHKSQSIDTVVTNFLLRKEQERREKEGPDCCIVQ